MILNNEQLRHEARQLALKHDPLVRRRPSKRLLRNLESGARMLRTFAAELRENRSDCSQPAEEWLLDHAEFLEEQVLSVRHELSNTFTDALPYLSKTGELRVFSICAEYIGHADGNLNEDSFIAYLQAYQEVSVLTIAEAWAIPLMLRIALIRRLAGIMETVRERREMCALADRVLDGIATSGLTPERLKKALEEAGQDMPLSGPLIVHLVKHLRERAEDTATVGEWLICKLENGPESLDRILSYEYQLQAANQVTAGNLIGSLRKVSRWDWRETFERISMVEQTLRKESSGDYARLDYSSRDTLRKRVVRLARRMHIPENLVASHAVELAASVYEEKRRSDGGVEELPRNAFAAYYLLETDGIAALRESLKICGKPRALPETPFLRRTTGMYFNLLSVIFVIAWIGFSVWIGRNAILTPLEWAFILAVLLLPAAEWAVTAVHWFIERVKSPVPLLRYDLSDAVPPEASTMVVIPVIWSTVEEVREMTERLELHYLANRDPNVHFAILSDFKDAEAEKLPEDEPVVKAAEAEIDRLNRAYPESKFHLFQRSRQWNASERVWMGWERKRGKLAEFVELLKGDTGTSFDAVRGDAAVLRRIRYIITLDADTQLPLESVHRMIGTIHLPFNRPRLNEAKTRVIEGYGVLQPRIAMRHESAVRSRLSYLWSGGHGTDPYSFAVSDPYQDGMGEGIFTGKGIFDVDAFYQVLCERIPENRVLSHDLLEGGFLRAGLLSDIELIDDHPATYSAYQKRQLRWVRGDWQLLLWLMPKVRNRRGELLPVDLSVLTRWQIIDNLRRSLLPPVLFAILLLSLNVLPGSSAAWIVLVFATWFLPVIRQIAAARSALRHSASLGLTTGQVLVGLMTLPFQTVLLINAIARTLWRLMFTKRGLLEWVSSSEVERRSKLKGAPPLLGMFGGYVLVVVFLAETVRSGSLVSQAIGFSLTALWIYAPFAVRWLEQPPRQEKLEFSAEETEELRRLSREIWSFYEDYVTEEDNWLPPDNVQIEPPNGVARRTSPTNIGLYLSCALAARDFGFIDTPGLIERLERTLSTIERLEKWEGHLYNWYDTATLKSLPPLYVSTVDSGNLVTCLMTVKEGVKEWLEHDDMAGKRTESGSRTDRGAESLHVAFAEEISPAKSAEPFAQAKNDWRDRGNRVVTRLERLVQETNFRPLYDHKTKLFSLGYHAGGRERDQVLYDLMASEARQASFVAVALGQVSVSHWHALGRTMTKSGTRPLLLSWSGTMFEYLMPWLFLRTYRNTVWESTYRAVVGRQIEYARQRGVPFGISESGYYAFDFQMNYQYRAFGVPGLGFKRGLEQDLVVSPYAAVLAMPFAKHQALDALKRMEQLGGRGKYGYYEALDFTPERMPRDRRHIVIRSFMAHHQGMSMLTLANLLLPQTMYGRFHRDKRVRTAEMLLQERIPQRPKFIKHPSMHRVHAPLSEPVQDTTSLREYSSAITTVPEVCVLSNGTFTTVVTNSGSGFSRYEGLSVSRWREDPVTDPWGSFLYIRDVTKDVVWSPSYQPCRSVSQEQRVQFFSDRATFMRADEEMQTVMEICVSPEWNAEVRRITLTNTGKEAKILEVTTFVELALAHPNADDAHPAFSKLFVRTDYDEKSGCLVAGRRPREQKDRTLWAAHSLIADGNTIGAVEYETDRAGFIGRGHRLSEPQGIRSRLRGTVGSVADPAFAMRRRIHIEPGEKAHLFAVTSVADTKETAVDTVLQLTTGQAVDRAFQLAWNRGQIELRNLRLTNREAAAFQMFASQVLYNPPLRKEREQSISSNVKGQSGLWSFGVSGDRPVVLARIDHRSQLPFVVKLLTGHEYLRRLGISFDLVLLNESAEGYYQELQEALQRAAEHGVDRFGAGLAGVYVIPANQLREEDKTLLAAVARIVLRAGGPSFAAQIQLPKDEAQAAWPEELARSAPVNRYDGRPVQTNQDDAAKWLFYNGSGGFSPDGKEYRIMIRNGKHLPSPWINVLANPHFGCFVSELGTGYTWFRNSRECKLTPWSNDPVLDPPGETGYLRDEESGEAWSLAPSAMRSEPPYRIAHGRGYTKFDHQRHGIEHEMTVFVPLQDPVKIMRLKLRNNTSEPRRMSVTYYAEWVIGVQRHSNAPYIVTEWNESASILTARNMYQETFRDATAFLGVYPQPSSGGESNGAHELSWTVDRNEFIGRGGSMESPAALNRARLSGRTGACYDSCGAIQAKFILEPDSEKVVYILLGCGTSDEAASKLALQYSGVAACEKALKEVTDFWEHTLDQIVVSTPSPEADVLLNGWLLYQTLVCRMWARTAFYQAGGAYGFRDQLQDSLALLHTRPDLARAQIVLHASHQYEEGDVQHWWHEETGRGIRTLFSDDLLWLPYAVSRYVEHTGDGSILDETAPFLHSEPLREGEHERYEPTQHSGRSATIYEHCLRAIDKALQRMGEHALPLIGVGDWNDGMNLVGAEGRGESVWLGWFICEVLRGFAEHCRTRGDTDREAAFEEIRSKLTASLNEHAWDGQWYRRAFTDSGQWLGSIRNEECRIDAIAQSWSVISGAAPEDRAVQAMQSFDRELVDRDISVARLLTPPFDKTDLNPGYIQGYPPGIRENGAQYTHGVIWSIVAWCQLGNGDKAFELFHMLNPLTHTRTNREVMEYGGEPYVMAADVYTAEPHKGHAGWTWYTGAAGWMYQAGIEWILGIRRRGEKLYIDPEIPADWPGYSATYRFGKARYHITVKKSSGTASEAGILLVDGKEVPQSQHKPEQGVCFELRDDGQEHHVELTY
ncbi:GH36-type glycosyl hydrolase domain-containing protein [Paenibacillus alkalitolerans]|uniref:GH36-type glycosyl hydrolase domain-containing protein n=1 Tax=Paenibacillus alkalitolerans TaxID=2799335 RepID=UPI0018F3A5ED|nr:glucoamylase family protein [Paenibacillus alkalitolerans]